MKKPEKYLLILIFVLPTNLFCMSDIEKKFDAYIKQEQEFTKKIPWGEFQTKYNHLEGYYEKMSHGKTLEEQLALKTELISCAEHTQPICHDKALIKAAEFLIHKKKSGLPLEQKVYQPLNLAQFIFRLYHNRPLVCYKAEDDTTFLQDDAHQNRIYYEKAYQQHLNIGTPNEKHPFVLQDIISYPEREISELFGISSPTFFINNGNRNNKGRYSETDDYEKKGIFAGLVGPRYENEFQMACTTLIDKKNKQNGDIEITQENVKNNHIFDRVALLANKYFRPSIHLESMKIRVEPFLQAANSQGKKTYVQAVGLGLGNWALFKEGSPENDIEIKASFKAYKELLEAKKFPNIDTIDFSWFTGNKPEYAENLFKEINDGNLIIAKNPDIKIKFSVRNTADKLTGNDDTGKILFVMYAWDSACAPGNEFWRGKGFLDLSGDPAAACCSLIASLQNPWINGDNIFKNIVKRIDQFLEIYPKYKFLMKDAGNTAIAPMVPALDSSVQTTSLDKEEANEKTPTTWRQKLSNLPLYKKVGLFLLGTGAVGSLYYYFMYPSAEKNTN